MLSTVIQIDSYIGRNQDFCDSIARSMISREDFAHNNGEVFLHNPTLTVKINCALGSPIFYGKKIEIAKSNDNET